MHTNHYLTTLVANLLATLFLLNVPGEFWTQVLALMEIPDEVKEAGSPFVGAACSTIVEVINNAIEQDKLQKEGKAITDYHDPTAKYWPMKIFVGSMTGLICMSLFSPAVIAIIPKAPAWTVGFIAGASGYWFVSEKLPGLRNKDENEKKEDET